MSSLGWIRQDLTRPDPTLKFARKRINAQHNSAGDMGDDAPAAKHYQSNLKFIFFVRHAYKTKTRRRQSAGTQGHVRSLVANALGLHVT